MKGLQKSLIIVFMYSFINIFYIFNFIEEAKAQYSGVTKVAFVYLTTPGNHGWTYAHELGKQMVKKHFGNNVNISIIQNVPEGPNATRVIRELANQGNEIIFTTSFGYMEPTLKVAKEYPSKVFVHVTGYKRLKNLFTVNIRFYQSDYISGIVAGLMTKTNKIGYIGAYPIAEQFMRVNAFASGVKTVNQRAKISLIWANTWYDPVKEAKIAKSLIKNDVDILNQGTESPAALQVAEKNGILGFGSSTDMSPFAPNAQIFSPINNWGKYYINIIKKYKKGFLNSGNPPDYWNGNTWGGFESGILKISTIRNVPSNIKQKILLTLEDIKNGRLKIFEGPIIDNKGKQVLPFGQKYDDGALWGMNYYFSNIENHNNLVAYSNFTKTKNKKQVTLSKPKVKTYTKPKSTISSAKLNAERKKRLELERELAEIKNKQKQEEQRINTDNQKPIINAFTKQNGSNATISGRVTDNTEVAEVLIDGEQLSLTNNGTFKTKLYIPRNGLNVQIFAYDRKGNKASKLLKIERENIQQASGPVFDTLNPSGKRVKSNPNALALIIGIADYSKTNADALYSDKDAQQFYDYATMKLGIPSSNIKELVNAKADRVEITLAVKDWIARSTKSGKTDIYVFFAGHGLSTADGKDMFLLPYDGLPRLLQDSAIKRDQLFADIQKANPKSVTVFLDTCYSGTTRGTDMLIASRPIAIRALEQSIPNNFTVFSAAAGDQTSKPLEEAKHGMFSYFLMKGMEGDADSNKDNKITARELHAYVEQNVVQQSSGSQTPELQGDKDRVLVQFN